jgi:transposase
VALADGGKRGEVREHGKIFNTPAALAKLASKLGQGGRKLKFCYEAGPRGYGIQRQLSAAGYECIVVAPSPSQPEPATGSRPTGAMQSISPSHIEPVN